jgi:hypothetical protein
MVKIKVRKYNVWHDELKRNGTELCRFLRFERLDESHKGVFKCGRTSQHLSSRNGNYHSCFRIGVFRVFFLQYPRIQRG